MWITNGTRADFITLAVRTGDPGYGGISLFTFPTDVKGFTVSKKLDKIGNLSSDTAILYFEDCRIPARYLLGEENEGFYHIMTNFQGERLVAAIIAVAGHGAAWSTTPSATATSARPSAGRSSSFQVWRHKFVEHLAAIEAAKRLTYHAVELFDAKENPVKEISHGQARSPAISRRRWPTTASSSTAAWATSTRPTSPGPGATFG